MTELKEQIENAINELRKEKERKFNQTVDLIINLQKFDLKKTNVNIAVSVPHKIKDKKMCAFLEATNKNIDTITKEDFGKYKDKGELKRLVNKYDFFIAQASVMPAVATTFGRVLGPAGKMPSPQLGIIVNADDKVISELKERVNNSVKIKIKEASIKIPIGKANMKSEDVAENVLMVYNAVMKELPKNKDNIKNIEVKFTMTKPIKIKIR